MDPISNMLISIKNAGNAGLSSAMVPYSKLKLEIANTLKEEGYVGNVSKRGKKGKKFIGLDIVYRGKNPRITNVARVSKPSRRIYIGVKDIKPVRQGYGALILSTPKGILTDKKAKEEHVGGEALFKIW
jgi:small subunit ribosomal protein S8